MDEKTFDKILGTPIDQNRDWQRYGLRSNPFPSRAHPIWDVFYGQAPLRDRFLDELAVFVTEGRTTTLFLTGGNRVGKTHFMEHYRRRLPKEFGKRGLALPIAVLSAQSGDFTLFYRQLIEQIDDCLQQQTGSGLFQHEPTATIAAEDLTANIPPGDLRRAIGKYLSAPAKTRADVGMWLRKWIRGERIRLPQRNLLDVTASIDSPGQMLNSIQGIVKYLCWIGAGQPVLRCPGVLVFLDEFELIWKQRRDRRDQFLQGLREMLDCCPDGIFLCIGMATGLGVEVREVEAAYPALFARLRGHAHRPIPALVQVGSVVDAIGYAKEFLKHGRSHAAATPGRDELPAVLSDADVLSEKEVERYFNDLAGTVRSVAQGDFFDRLHEVAESKVRSKAPPHPKAPPPPPRA